MIELNDNNFKQKIGDKSLVLVDFYATWCGPCGVQSKILDKLNNSRGLNFDIVKVNVDEAPNIALEYGVESIPTLMIFKRSEAVKKTVGLTDEERIIEMMEEYSD